MKTLITTMLITATAFPLLADDAHHGQHRMPDGSMMADHAMPVPAAAKASQSAAVKSGDTRILARVNGLVCDFCAQGIRKTLMKEPDVTQVQVDLSAKQVTVDLSRGGKLEEAHLGNLLKAAGYDMTSYEVQ